MAERGNPHGNRPGTGTGTGSRPARSGRPSRDLAGSPWRTVQVLRQVAPGARLGVSRARARAGRDPYRDEYVTGEVIEPPLPPEHLLALVEQNAIHAACIAAKAYDAVGRGWLLEPEGGDRARQQAGQAGQPDIEALTADLSARLEALTPDLSFSELLFQAAYEREAIGWSAWEVVRNADGSIGAIYPLPAHTVRATRDPELWCQGIGLRRRYFVTFGSERVVDPRTGRDDPALSPDERASEILLFRGYAPRSAEYGVPLWVSAAPAIVELAAIREYNISWFASGGMADRLLHVQAADPATAEAISTAIREQFQAAKGIGHTTVFSAGTPDVSIDVKLLSPSAEGRRDGQFSQRREDLIREVLMAHAVPPYRIGWAELGGLGGNAAREMLRSYKQDAVQPLQTLLEDRLNQTLFGPKGFDLRGVRWRFAPLSWDETELNLDLAVRAVEAGILSPNEGRTVLGLSPVNDPAMDRHYRQGAPLGAVAMRESRESRESVTAGAVRLLEELQRALEASIAAEGPPKPALPSRQLPLELEEVR
jgi:PBSX family phage portal protein